MRPHGVSICLVLAFSSQAFAADLEARARIEAVTVYPEGADVTRIAEIELQQGPSNLIFRGVPQNIDVSSLRVIGEANGALKIGGVEARLVPSENKAAESSLETRLKSLRGDRSAWRSTVEALTAKRAMIIHYSQASPEKLSPDSKPLETSQWTAAFDLIGSALAKVEDEIRAAQLRVQELDDEIKNLETTRIQPKGKPPAYDVSVAVDAGGALKGKLSLSYRVSGAGWRPVYDARLNMASEDGKPTLEMIRRALITQQTGEEWTEAALTISTVRTAQGIAAPDLGPERVDFLDFPLSPAPVALSAKAASRSAEQPAAPPTQAAPAQANPYQAAFALPGRVTISSDGASKSFFLSSYAYAPKLTLKSAPELDPAAYLEAKFANQEDAPFLPGVVNILRDGAFIGVGRLPYTPPNDEIRLGLGADDKMKISRTQLKRKENNALSSDQTKFETWDVKTVVKNLHNFPVRFALSERTPFSANTAIVVEMVTIAPPPNENGGDAKLGVKNWTMDLGPQEQKEFRLTYRIKWPGGRSIAVMPIPSTETH